MTVCPMPSTTKSVRCLVLLTTITLSVASTDWSWRVRYTAVQGLVRLCRHLVGDKMASGLYNISWTALHEANAYEQDDRVLEALKVGQVRVRAGTEGLWCLLLDTDSVMLGP